jgi:DNA replication protein DnaC
VTRQEKRSVRRERRPARPARHGKTHLSIALGIRACLAGSRVAFRTATEWVAHAANLMFMLVSRRYERASLIVTSNKPFSAWGEIFGDEVTAAAMIDRLVHHAEILALKGDSYRLKDRDLARPARDD